MVGVVVARNRRKIPATVAIMIGSENSGLTGVKKSDLFNR